MHVFDATVAESWLYEPVDVALVVRLGSLALCGEVFFDIALREFVDRRSVAFIPSSLCRIFAPIDTFAQVLGFEACGFDSPCGMRTYPDAIRLTV